MPSRIGYNIHAQRVPDVNYLLSHVRALQPKWLLAMDGIGLCQQLKAQSPATNVISRIYPDKNWSAVNAKDWVARKKAEIGSADVWCYTFNEVGYSNEYIQLNIDIIKEAAKVGLKVVVINTSVGTPAPETEWNKPKSIELLRLLDAHRDHAVLGLHEYACAVVTSGFYGGYPDNAGVQPGTPGGVNLIPQANWPTNPTPCYHLGRFQFMLDVCAHEGITPPRVVLTEHGFDDVSDIKAWTKTLDMTDPYQDIRGWKSCKDQWKAWYPNWAHDQAYYEQLKYADQTLYQHSPVEAQLLFCWGHTSEMWAQFDVAEARDLHALLLTMPPETDGGNGGEIPMVKTDLLPYLNGNGVRRLYKLGHNQAMGGGVELVQTQLEGDGFRHVKQGGAEPFAKWERLRADANWICRDLDTSGNTQVYRIKDSDLSGWSRWCPRFMTVGEKYHRNPILTWLNKANGQTIGTPAPDPSDIKLIAVLPSYHIPESNLTIANVIKLEWIPNGFTQWEEIYYYGKDFGLVAWENRAGWRSYVSELTSADGPPVPELAGVAWAAPPAFPAIPPPNTTPPVTYPFPPASDAGWKVKNVKATSGSSNVRQQPNTQAAIVGTVKTEKPYNLNESKGVTQADGVWIPIVSREGEWSEGWARSDVIVIGAEVLPPQPTQPVTFTMTATVETPAGTDINALKAALSGIKLSFTEGNP